MNEREGAHVALITAQGSKVALRTFQSKLQAMIQTHTLAGRLQSGLTIGQAVRLMEEQIREIIPDMITRVGEVSRAPEAFAAVEKAVNQLVLTLEAEMHNIVRIADGKQPGEAITPSVAEAAKQLLADWNENLALEIRLARADFLHVQGRPPDAPPPDTLKTDTKPTDAAPPVETPPSPGPGKSVESYSAVRGRPKAGFWDDLWIFIAVEILAGRIAPESQSDILGRMLQWASDGGHSLSESSARSRARKLATASAKELNSMTK